MRLIGIVFGGLFIALGVFMECVGVIAGDPMGLFAEAAVIAASGGAMLGIGLVRNV